MTGPGAMASPDRNADHPQAPCSQRTIERSIAANDAEKKMATSDAPVKRRERNSDGSMSGLRLRRQCRTKSARSAADAASVAGDGVRAPAPVAPLDEPEGEGRHARRGEHDPERVGPFAIVTGYVRQPAPADDEGSDPDRHIDQEDPPPARCDQQPADDWADGGGHATDRRPGSNCTLPALCRVGGEDQPEGGRGQ